jgi:hypothetical protein
VSNVTVHRTDAGNDRRARAVDDSVIESNRNVQEGDVIEFTLRGERRTAEAMLITDDGLVLLDLFDGDRPAWARLSILDEVVVFRPDVDFVTSAA